MAQLSTEADVSHADGKAHFVALARPLLEKITPGVYRELAARARRAGDRTSSARLQQWMASTAGQRERSVGRAPAGAVRPRARSTRRPRQPAHAGDQRCCCIVPGGRGSRVSHSARRWLGLAHPGIAVLSELLERAGWRSPPRAWRRRSSAGASARSTGACASWRPAKPLVPDGAAAGRELSAGHRAPARCGGARRTAGSPDRQGS